MASPGTLGPQFPNRPPVAGATVRPPMNRKPPGVQASANRAPIRSAPPAPPKPAPPAGTIGTPTGASGTAYSAPVTISRQPGSPASASQASRGKHAGPPTPTPAGSINAPSAGKHAAGVGKHTAPGGPTATNAKNMAYTVYSAKHAKGQTPQPNPIAKAQQNQQAAKAAKRPAKRANAMRTAGKIMGSLEESHRVLHAALQNATGDRGAPSVAA